MIISDVDFVDDLKIESLTGGTSVRTSATASGTGDVVTTQIGPVQNSNQVVESDGLGIDNFFILSPFLGNVILLGLLVN